MKCKFLLLAAMVAAGLAAPALSQSPPSDAPLASFASMDADADGSISGSEHEDAAKRMFEEMDANDDDKVTAEEMDAAQERITGGGPYPGDLSSEAKMVPYDTNGDGVISDSEHAIGAAGQFTKMDADRDGALSPGELEAGRAAIRAAYGY